MVGSLDVDAVGLKGQETATAKFDEGVDVAVRLGVDPKHADQMVRGAVALPHGTGKDVRVVGLCSRRSGERPPKKLARTRSVG